MYVFTAHVYTDWHVSHFIRFYNHSHTHTVVIKLMETIFILCCWVTGNVTILEENKVLFDGDKFCNIQVLRVREKEFIAVS